jgi:hypothetical protein
MMRRIDDAGLSSDRLPGRQATLLPDPEPLFCPIVSVDDHVLEPVDVFTRRMPRALTECHVYRHPQPPAAVLAASEVGRAMRDGVPLGAQLQEV